MGLLRNWLRGAQSALGIAGQREVLVGDSNLAPDGDRSCLLPVHVVRSIQAGILKSTYRGVPCLKSPFDLVLYSELLFKLRPRTIVEIGTASGGSALWFSDLCRSYGGEPTRVLSLDLRPPKGLEIEGVTFLQGDVHRLGDSELPDLLARAERPLFVVEDGPHTYDGCLAALRFFDPYLHPGEYIVVEDGIVGELGPGYEHFADGPRRAIATFLAEHPGRYEIDVEACDRFGPNVTWNPNGYLRRLEPPAAARTSTARSQ